MHNIKRIQEPKSLKDNKKKWTEELLKEVAEKGDFSKVDDSYKNHYKKDDIRDSLKKMNGDGNGYCYYCEQKIGKTDYGHIEHFKPKNQFPELCFEWDNLHWSCSKCNIKKGIKWNNKIPIINPCDNKIDVNRHISYKLYFLIGETEMGWATIDTFLLNEATERKELVDSRLKVFNELLIVIQKINTINDSAIRRRKIEKLKRYASEFEFKGMIEFTIKSFLLVKKEF